MESKKENKEQEKPKISEKSKTIVPMLDKEDIITLKT